MFDGLRRVIFGNKTSSKQLAKSRLHFVLVQDRTGLSAEELAKFKTEMVDVIERYFVIQKQAFDISYRRDGETTTLVINSPVIVRRQDAVHHEAGTRKFKKKKHELAKPPPPPSMPVASNT
mgnify:CR=1 FL=1